MGWACRPLRHDGHLNDASIPQRRISGPADRIWRDACVGLTAIAVELKPTDSAVQAFRRSAPFVAATARLRACSARASAGLMRLPRTCCRDLVALTAPA